MATIERLVDVTKRMKAGSDVSVGWPLAAIRAIESQGIRNKSDIDRLKEQILAELRRDGTIPQRRLR